MFQTLYDDTEADSQPNDDTNSQVNKENKEIVEYEVIQGDGYKKIQKVKKPKVEKVSDLNRSWTYLILYLIIDEFLLISKFSSY